MTLQRTKLLNFTATSKPCPSLHYPPPPRKLRLWHIFIALPAMNSPFSAKLKFKENTVLSLARFWRTQWKKTNKQKQTLLAGCWSPIRSPWVWINRLLFWKKVWKTSWILDPKICTNPGEGKTGVPGVKFLGARGRTNNQLKPHRRRVQTQAKLVGGEYSHHCTTLAPIMSKRIK